MKGINKWDTIITVFKNFLKEQTKIPNHENKFTFTVVLFSDITRIIFREKIANIDLLNQIRYRGGGDNFEKAFDTVYELLREVKDKDYESILVIFMSDGGCTFPKESINKINKDDLKIRNKTYFHILTYGNDNKGILINREIEYALNGEIRSYENTEKKSNYDASIEVINVPGNFNK